MILIDPPVQPAAVDPASTAWMLVATALVLLMTPALAFFYGGLVRAKNALNTMMMSVGALGAITVAWALLGYSLAFAPGGPLVGGSPTRCCTAWDSKRTDRFPPCSSWRSRRRSR